MRRTTMVGPFRGTEAVAAGAVTRGELTGPRYRRVFRDAYLPSDVPLTHELRCRCAALILPRDVVITGRSAAALRGVPLASATDPVEVVAGLGRHLARRSGIDLRRCAVTAGEFEAWQGIQVATPARAAFDLLLDRPLAASVGDLDAVLRAKIVDRTQVLSFLRGRHDRGIRQARKAVELTDSRAESPPESIVRVHLTLAGMSPVPQYWIEDHRGRIACADLALPDRRLAVEYDGQWRNNEMWALNHDRQRLNRVREAGWEVVFVTAPLLRDPRRLVATVRAAYESRR